jgi:hypothetical protein
MPMPMIPPEPQFLSLLLPIVLSPIAYLYTTMLPSAHAYSTHNDTICYPGLTNIPGFS